MDDREVDNGCGCLGVGLGKDVEHGREIHGIAIELRMGGLLIDSSVSDAICVAWCS